MLSDGFQDLYTKFQQAIYDVQQRSGLKNLILEKKIDTVEEAARKEVFGKGLKA